MDLLAAIITVPQDIDPTLPGPGAFEVTLSANGVAAPAITTTDTSLTISDLDNDPSIVYTATARRLDTAGGEYSPPTPVSNSFSFPAPAPAPAPGPSPAPAPPAQAAVPHAITLALAPTPAPGP